MTLHLSEFRVYVAINGDTYSSRKTQLGNYAQHVKSTYLNQAR